MSGERWRRVEEVFHAAIERAPRERASFLDAACSGDAELRREVESLLAYHEKEGSFIDRPAFEEGARLLSDGDAGARRRLSPGQRLGPYEVVALVGAGGMGEVYLARDARLGRRVALKLLSDDFTRDDKRLRRFRQEASAASNLNHPNILTIHEIGHEGGIDFIATEFIDGETLRERMARGPVELSEALDVSLQVASALAAAHEAGVVHRDVKPENIMVRRDGYVKVLDFGLAKLVENTAAVPPVDADALTLVRTDPGVIMGTARYMSPEQARGQEVDARTDVWSLGCVLYEMLAGRAPFVGETPSHVIVSVLESAPPRLEELAPGVPAEFERIVAGALEKDRATRYQSVKDMLTDLRELKRRLELDAELGRPAPSAADTREPAAQTTHPGVARPTSGVRQFVRGFGRYPRNAALALVIFLAAVSAAAYFYRADRGDSIRGRGERPAGGDSGGRAEAPIESIAVLPFANVGADPEAEYLSDGITESLINNLSRLSGLKVIARSSVFEYKGKEADPQAVARELNVRAVLTGRVVQRGDMLSVSAELTDVPNNRQLWGEQYHRKLSDLLGVQQDISREISGNLRLRLTGAEERRLAKLPTTSEDAYRLYLLGDSQVSNFTNEDIAEGIETLKQAVGIDPNFAQAYAALASAYYNSHQFSPPKEAMLKAKEAALRALQIDDALAEAHTQLAWIRFVYDYDPAGADSDFRRATALNPGASQPHSDYGLYLAVMNRRDEALGELKRAEELDPLSLGIKLHLGVPFFYAHEYDLAIEQFRKAVDAEPEFGYARGWLGAAYLRKGMYAEAVAEFNKAIQTSDDPYLKAHLGMAYGVWGREAEARKVLDQLKRLSKKQYVPPICLAYVHAGLGEKGPALDWLERAFEYRDPIVMTIKNDAAWDSLRAEERFRNLLRMTGHGE